MIHFKYNHSDAILVTINQGLENTVHEERVTPKQQLDLWLSGGAQKASSSSYSNLFQVFLRFKSGKILLALKL